jgi:hypothetical protein
MLSKTKELLRQTWTIAQWSSWLVAFVFIAVPLFFLFLESDVDDPFGTLMIIIGTEATLATLFIALKLYSKYELEKSVVNKQFETVCRMIEKMKSINLVIINHVDVTDEHHNEYRYEGTLVLHPSGMNTYLLSAKPETAIAEYGDRYVNFGTSYNSLMTEVRQIAESTYMPKHIATKIRPLIYLERSQAPGVEWVQFCNCDQYMHLLISCQTGYLSTKEMYTEFDLPYLMRGNKYKTFIESWHGIYNMLVDWIKDHDIDTKDLNIEIKDTSREALTGDIRPY